MVGFLFVVALICLSQSSTLIRFAEASSLAICFWRLLMAAVMLAPWALTPANRQSYRSLSHHDRGQLFLSGLFLFLHLYFFFRAVQETTIANALIIYSINPVITAIGAYVFFRERVSLHLAFAGLLGLGGVIVVFSGGSPVHVLNAKGDIWSLLSAALFSGYLLTGKYVRRRLTNTTFAASVYLQVAVYAAIAMLFFDVPFTGYSERTWWMFLALAIFPTLLGHMIISYCLNFMNVNFMSCAKLVEPVLSVAAAAWLFGEPLTRTAAFGFVLTATSVLILYWESLREFILRKLQKA